MKDRNLMRRDHRDDEREHLQDETASETFVLDWSGHT
jgi:hypothetical protein